MKNIHHYLLLLIPYLLYSDEVKLRIDENGKVGIGVANPSTKLEIDGSVTVGNVGVTESPKAGTIKFEDGDFMGFDGTSWRSMTQGSSSSQGNSTGTNTDTSGSLLALPTTSAAPSGYSFIQSLDKQFSWQKLADRNYESTGGALEGLNQKLYFIGGLDSLGSPQPSEKFDPASNSWSVIQSPSFSRMNSVTAASDDKVYLLPGRDPTGSFRDLEIYDPEKNSWSFGTELPDNYVILEVFSAVMLDGKIYCSAKGTTPAHETEGEVILTYDTQTAIWNSFVRTEDLEYSDNFNTTPYGWTFVVDGKLSVLSNSGMDDWISYYSTGSNQWSWGPHVPLNSFSVLENSDNRLLLGGMGRISVFDFRTGITRSFSLNGIIDDDFSYASAVILENELYVCSSLGNQSSSGLYKSSLSNFLDLYVKD